MSSFKHSAPCPACRASGGDRSGNNLAIYSDFHEWCFACGYFKPPTLEYRIRPKQEAETKQDLFSPCTKELPQPAYAYLKQYGLTNQEIGENYLWHDDGLLIFNGDKFHCGRNFSGTGPKYVTKGKVKGNEVIFTNVPDDLGAECERLLSSIVIVEDAVSAIKISRVCSAVPLMGAVIPMELILRLSKQFKNVFVWLDPDKKEEAPKQALKAAPFFDKVVTIWSGKDPKYYPNKEIKEFLDVF